MALFDDRRFLLSHINHSFITGDDTGICEVVMLDEDVFENQHQRCLKLFGQYNLKPEERLDQKAYDLEYESELLESEQGQSYDIASDLDYICHRRRSNTAQRLDRLKQEKMNQSRTRTIVWHCNSPTGSHSEDRLSQDSPLSIEEENTKKSENGTTNHKPKSPPIKSGLTRLLEKFPSLPKNPFDEFAQFDGGMSETVPVKKIMIFIAITQHQQQSEELRGETHNDTSQQPNQTRNITDRALPTTGQAGSSREVRVSEASNDTSNPQTSSDVSRSRSNLSRTRGSRIPQSPPKPKTNEPLEVVIVSTAKVQDLIGLICWQYTNEGREPKLYHDINLYCLRIAEDNGEVDPDFGSLNPKEPLSKFNFPSLALTEKSEERVKSYNDNYSCRIYNHRLPTLAQDVITNETRMKNYRGKFSAVIRFIFRDATLNANQ